MAKILILDIECIPLLSHTWGLWDQNVGLNQIDKEWSIVSWSAKWHKKRKIFHEDLRGRKDVRDDKPILKGIWKLMNEADIIVTQNGKKFDIKKLNARFIINGFGPPSAYQQIDTLQMAKKSFAFTSNKLEYTSEKLCKSKKKKSKKFEGFDLWRECINGNLKAWDEMKRYNNADVIATEALYDKLIAWDSNSANYNVFFEDGTNKCSCGHNKFFNNGWAITSNGRFRRYKCKRCGKNYRGKENLLDPLVRKKIFRPT